MHSALSAAPGRELFLSRLLIGAVQGATLYLLLRAAGSRSGIGTMPTLFSPSFLIALFIPPALIVSLKRTSGIRVTLWAVVLAAVVALLGHHDAWRTAGSHLAGLPFGDHRTIIPFPSAGVTFYSCVIVFTAYCLVLAGETTRSWLAPYETYFEISWKLGLQACLSLLFVNMLFLVLWLGAALFLLVRLHFLQQLLVKPWFSIPVAALAFASALHITDVRADIIRGSRTLVLSLMSWLLLILVVVVGGFLISLPFAGLGLLWATRSATWILLGVAAFKIVFVNAVFKGGPGTERAPRVLRVCMRIACFMLLALVALATYALALRIAQYGLTSRRVMACAGALVAWFYAIGYTWAALTRTDTLARIAPVNVVTAWVTLIVLVALCTPVADPARLSVDSQTSRLLAGKVAPEKFDYAFLKQGAARYGQEALAALQKETRAPNASAIRDLSAKAAQPSSGVPGIDRRNAVPDAKTLSIDIVSRTAGKQVPATFLSQDWQKNGRNWMLPGCLNNRTLKCDAYLVDLTGDQKINVVLFPNGGSTGFVFDQSDDNDGWQLLGKFSIAPDCTAVRDALAKGTFQLLQPRLRDIQINGRRVELQAMPSSTGVCASLPGGA